MELKQYAASTAARTAKRVRCMTCKLDETVIAEIHAARVPGPDGKTISFPTIASWLRVEHGADIHPATIRNHFVGGHHEAK